MLVRHSCPWPRWAACALRVWFYNRGNDAMIRMAHEWNAGLAAMAATMPDNLEAYLAPFGLSSFRPGQRAVIETVFSGRDCLCVMPTGGGKSLCYQLPAIARGGVTLVISPLIALMKDQVDQLTARDLPATFINSTLTQEEQNERLEGMASGQYRLVYVVPERFRSPRFVDAARRCELTLLAVDEAHCVSEWGHDFRPDYARLGRFRAQLGNPPTIALTATATDAVRRDIVELLALDDPQVFITGFERPNLFYRAQVAATDREKDEVLMQFLADNAGSGIVYASTRKRCEELAERITSRAGRSTTVYHAGLGGDERRAAQDNFMQGRSEIAVATLAFGMGIDKADVRFVVHYNLPGSLEAYYQEAGRAGRDGQPAQCLLLVGGGDRRIHEFFIESAYPSRDVVRQVYEFLSTLEQSPIELTQQEVKEALGLQVGGEAVGACEKLLEAAGVLERLEPNENAAAVRLNSDLPTLVDLLPRNAVVKRQVLRALEHVVGQARHEWRYVQPRTLLRELTELDSTTLARHLRELSSSLDAVDYAPPFRGRAIYMRHTDRRFDELAIDFEALEAQKAAEYRRLERVVSFASRRGCRQQQILEYFGQVDAEPCGHCDNCHAQANSTTHGELDAKCQVKLLEATRIVLSGVARVNRTRSGVGKRLLASMLCGKSNKQIVRNRLDKLTTFGLLAYLKETQVVELVDALLMCGLLEQTEIEPFRPVVRLTERGVELMSGRNDQLPQMPLSAGLLKQFGATSGGHNDGGTSASADAMPAPDRELVATLRQWREETCRAAAVPAYVVLSNAVIDELARLRPTSADELLGVKGIGPAKVRQYGEQLLRLLTATPPAPQPSEQAAPRPSDIIASSGAQTLNMELTDVPETEPLTSDEPLGISAGEPVAARPSHYWTWRMLMAGFSPEECAIIRSIEPEVVLDHALRASDGGLAVEPRWFLSDETIDRIEQLLAQGPTTRIRQLLDHLPRGTRYEHVQLVLKARDAAGASGRSPS
jgi:ATP-dependent DNA helicase RecQ